MKRGELSQHETLIRSSLLTRESLFLPITARRSRQTRSGKSRFLPWDGYTGDFAFWLGWLVGWSVELTWIPTSVVESHRLISLTCPAPATSLSRSTGKPAPTTAGKCPHELVVIIITLLESTRGACCTNQPRNGLRYQVPHISRLIFRGAKLER